MKEKTQSAATLGMWIFLGSELLFFGGLFLSLTIYRHVYPEAFSEGTKHLNAWIGAVNTLILLTSSMTIALAVENKKPRIYLLLSFVLGILFLLLKAYEYYQHYQEGLFPILKWGGGHSPQLLLFFLLYFLTTGIHALHLIIGLSFILWLSFRHSKNEADAFLKNIGLYWHFVDIIWVFIFPLLYLVGRN